MSIYYPHLMSPIRIGDIVLKNRMTASCSVPHFLQGPEAYPSKAIITHLANKAKSGAAMVTARGILPRIGTGKVSKGPDIPHIFDFDLYDPKCQNYLSQLADAIHFYGSKACMNLAPRVFEGYDVSAGLMRPGMDQPSLEMNEAQIQEAIDAYVEEAEILKSLGFDACCIHMAYRFHHPGRFLSPLTNHRQDQYGGSLENRARMPLETARRIKEACGQNFLIEAEISALEYEEGGTTIEDTIRFAKMAEGLIDILQLRDGDMDASHPIGYELKAEPFTEYARRVKASGTRVMIETIGGYFDPDVMEKVIAAGDADLIAMARSWISNVNYGKYLTEGRPDDLTPCIRCNKCHGVSMNGPWNSVCSVNPVVGLEHLIDQMVPEPGQQKRVGVIGGGPGGMKAALVAASRGHKVTLYEAGEELGGMLRHTDYADFKWPLRRFKDFLIRQTIRNESITVVLNTAATPEMIRREHYDALIVAIGAKPRIPDISGDGIPYAVAAADVFGNEEMLGHDVVIIGGGEVGMETAIYLGQKGFDVTVIEKRSRMAADATPMHYREMVRKVWEGIPNIHCVTDADCTKVTRSAVFYKDAEGTEHEVPAQSIVLAVGMEPKQEAAMDFYGCSKEFFMIGDCDRAGSVQTVMRSAFARASVL